MHLYIMWPFKVVFSKDNVHVISWFLLNLTVLQLSLFFFLVLDLNNSVPIHSRCKLHSLPSDLNLSVLIAIYMLEFQILYLQPDLSSKFMH